MNQEKIMDFGAEIENSIPETGSLDTCLIDVIFYDAQIKIDAI